MNESISAGAIDLQEYSMLLSVYTLLSLFDVNVEKAEESFLILK